MSTQKHTCSIHQPNFFPWLGYFDKIRRADVFIFLDDVAYPKSGSGMGSWTNRVKINIQGRAAWVGCPVRRTSGMQRILDVRIDDSSPWRTKLLKTLEANYKRSPNYDAAMAVIRPLIEYPMDNLADFNINAITAIGKALGLTATFERQSDLKVEEKATELLINLAKAVGADAYLCGSGAGGYQEDELFHQCGIELIYQNFRSEPYGQTDRFLPGLSVIDYLFYR
ncbi:MAG: hypothetical protein AUH86_16140 [Acidobacteria bacterium 13_1_40CM_4_58_4]|nr:MAG: hypothetical protein AUH86_16140 [Acidobacteria bacterium 13_1_40CM_4_58_4]